MERLNHSRPGPKDDSLETATARLEAPAGHLLANGKQVLLMLVAFTIVLGAVGWWGWKDLVRIDYFYDVLPGYRGGFEAAERELEAKVPDDQRLFFFANSVRFAGELREAWRQSCEANLPDDPAWLETYVAASGVGDRAQRDRIFEKARRIDAGNGLWDLREAGFSLGASKARSITSRPRGLVLGPALPMIITDPPFHGAVALIEKSVSAPRFQTTIPSSTTMRVAMLGRATDMAELSDRRMFGESQSGSGIYISKWDEFWEIRAKELESSQDREGLRRWFETFERFQSRCLNEAGDDRLYQLVRSFNRSRNARNFRDILSSAGLTEEAARLDHWVREARRPQPAPQASVEELSQKVGVPALGEWIHYHNAGLVDESELEPMRRAEHAMADRMFAVAAATLFGLLAWLAALQSWRRGQPVRGLAGGVAMLLRPSDFAWICGLGIALPAAWHVGVGITPLGARDYTIAYLDMLPFAMRAAGSFIFATCVLVQSVRWRLAKRGGLLGFRPSLWQGWALAGTAALFVPAVGAVRYLTRGQEEFLILGSSVIGLPILWLLWRSLAWSLCPRHAALPAVLVCRMLVPSFVTASLVLLGAAVLLEREEHKWVLRDTLSHPDPTGMGMPVVEARLAEMLRNHMLHAIDTAPAAK